MGNANNKQVVSGSAFALCYIISGIYVWCPCYTLVDSLSGYWQEVGWILSL